jgi:hypothetical protein
VITERQVEALNHLLHVQTGDKEAREASFLAICCELSFSECTLVLHDEAPEVARFASGLAGHDGLIAGIERLRRDASGALAAARVYRRSILARSHDPDFTTQRLLSSAYSHAGRALRLLEYIAFSLASSEKESSPMGVPEDADLGPYFELAADISQLIRVRDAIYRERMAKEKSRQRLGSAGLKGLKTPKVDREALRWELFDGVTKAVARINRHLDDACIEYRLQVDALSRLSAPVEMARHTGRPPIGTLRAVLQPFIEYVCDPSPADLLAVCEEPACGAVFLRGRTRPKSPYCRTACEPESHKST